LYLIKDEAGCLNECLYDEAGLLLFDIFRNAKFEGYMHFNFGDSTVYVNCIYFEKLNATCMYIKNDTDLRSLKKDTLLRISRLQYGPGLFPYGLVSQQDIVRWAFYITRSSIKRRSYKRTPIIDSWFAGTSFPPKLKVSANHLRHVTMNDLRRYGKDRLQAKVGYLFPMLERLAQLGMHEAMFVGIICWAMMLSKTNHNLSSISGIWDWQFSSIEDFVKKIKTNFSLRLKALQNLVCYDLEQFFELEVLVNRGVGAVDWQAERDHRVKPNLNKLPQAEVFTESVKLFRRLKQRGSKPLRTNWKKFWKSRWGWAPTGAYHSQYKEDQTYRAHEPTLRNKLFAVAKMPYYEFEHMANRTPEIVAWSSVKYEWGKQRAIYGVDFTNFVMTNFALYKCEELLEPVFPVGRAAREDIVKKRVQETLKNGVPFCFDFEDFNSQHSLNNMSDVLKAYALVFSDKLDKQQVEALNWVIESVKRGRIFNGDEEYAINGTLLSGWRLTTFINTILNHVYIKILTKDTPIVSIHNGDDVLSGVSYLYQIQNLQRQARKFNIRFQQSKCFLASIAEFLRVDHDKGSGSQYLARGVSTFVHGPTESVIPNDLISLLQSLKTRRNELLDRGADLEFVEEIFLMQKGRAAKLWDTNIESIEIIINTHLSKGGINNEVNEQSLSYEIERTPIRQLRDNSDCKDAQVALPGVWDYADQLCNRIIDESYRDKLLSTLTTATLSATVLNKFGVILRKLDTPGMFDTLRAKLNGILRSTQHGTKAMVAKAYGIPLFGVIGELDHIFDRLKEERDPIAAMKLLL